MCGAGAPARECWRSTAKAAGEGARATQPAIIHHGDVAPTDRDHCSHGHQVPRPDEADAGEPSQRRSRTSSSKAYEFSLKHHAGQTRASGEPYLVHPLEVALVLAEMKMDPVAIAAGLLHDSVEDTSVTIVDIRKEFGEQVAHIVEGVTKISKIDFATREEQQAENLRKMMLAMVDDIRVVLIKLADRLHNMRTLEHLPPERQQKIAEETLEIYAPIAHRLGMGKIRGELEDLGFRYLDPHRLRAGAEAVEARRKAGRSISWPRCSR